MHGERWLDLEMLTRDSPFTCCCHPWSRDERKREEIKRKENGKKENEEARNLV